MAIDVATLRATLVADTSKFQSAMRGAQKQTEKTNGKMKNAFAGFATKAKVGFALAGAAGAAFAKSAIDTASNINESLSKNQVLFGKYAKSVEQFSNRSAKSFGISKEAALNYTGVFGNLFGALGISEKQSSKFSVSLTKLAADMASFNNTSVEDALDAIRSGLVGESEPLRRFGVNLNDATMRAEALRMGLVKTTKEALTPQQKALTTQSLLYKQTAAAQGDFARTSGGLANQQRILSATVEDLKAKFGQALLPIALTVTKALVSLTAWVDRNRGSFVAIGNAIKSGAISGYTALKSAIISVIGVVKDIVSWFQKHRTTAQFLGTTLALLVTGFVAYRAAVIAASLATRAMTAATVALGVAMRLTPVGLVVTALAAVGAALVMAYQKSAKFRAIVTGAFKAVVAAGKAMAEALRFFVGAFYNIGKDMVLGLIHGIGGMIGAAVSKAKELAGGVVKAVKGLFDSHSPSRVFFDIGQDVAQGMINGLESKKNALQASFERMDMMGRMSALKKTAGSKDVKGKDDDAKRKQARQELAGMIKDLQRAHALKKIDIQIAGLEKAKALRDALSSIGDTLRGKVNDALDKFKDAWNQTQGVAFDTATETLLANTDLAKELAKLRDDQTREDMAAEDKRISDRIAAAQKSGDAQELMDAQAEARKVERERRITSLEKAVADERDRIQKERADQREALEKAAVAAEEARLNTSLDAEFKQLQKRKQNYAQFVADVQAILAPLGIVFEGDAGQAAAFGGGGGGMKRRPTAGTRVSGGIAGGIVNAVFNISTNDSDEATRKIHASLLRLQRTSGNLGLT